MRIRAPRILVTWYCLAVCLFIGAAPAEGLILCFGLDGHIEVSSPAAGCDGCSEQVPPAEGEPCSEQAGIGIDEESPCCPCLDVPVMSESDISGQKPARLSLELSVLLLATNPALEFPRERPRESARLGSPPPVATSFALSQLRSVILLI